MRWLLRRLVSDADRRVIDDDLAELYEIRRRIDGERFARRWLRRQEIAYPLHVLRDRAWRLLAETSPACWRFGRLSGAAKSL